MVAKAWNQQLAEFNEWLNSVDTSPAVVATLVALLQSWRQGSSFPYLVPWEVLLVAQDQQIIG